MAAVDQKMSVGAVRAEAPRHRTSSVVRIPPHFFGIALGLAGLSALWLYASSPFGAPASGQLLRSPGGAGAVALSAPANASRPVRSAA